MRPRTVLLVCAAFLAGAGSILVWKRPSPRPRTDLSGLRGQLDQAAARNLPLPTLAPTQITRDVPPDRIGQTIAEVIQIATDHGGSAMPSLDRGTDKVVLATVPRAQVPNFLAILQKLPAPPATSEPSLDGTETIEIVIHPVAP